MTASVTGCSTCSRVFISRKKNGPSRSSTNSTVPASMYLTAGRGHRRLRQPARRSASTAGCGPPHDLLVTALDAALALEQRDHRARGVRQHLHLDVARVRHVPLEEDRAVPERRRRLAAARCDGLGEMPGRRTIRMPRPPPPNEALTSSGKPRAAARSAGRRSSVMVDAGQHGHPGGGHDGLGLHLGTHRGDGVRRRADEDQPGVAAGAGERGVLRQETVPGVDRVGAGRGGGRDDQVAAQVGIGGGRPGRDGPPRRRAST